MGEPEAPPLVARRYRLGELLGRGGMGSVWRATDELLGREVALKRLTLADRPDDEAARARERTLREARIAASLHHPHVVTIFDVVVENAEPWLVLEYLPSASLGRMLRERGPLPVPEVAAIGAQVAAGLAAAHAAGIVHRDVKPDNVLVAGSTAKLSDFGISSATATPSSSQTGTFAGTPAYLAPETCRGEGSDARSDVYALGATLYAAVEGAPPFGTGGGLLALIGRIAQGDAPPPQRAGPLAALITTMLANDPAARPDAARVRDEVARVAREVGTTAPDRVPAHTAPVGTSRRGIVVVAALALVVAVAAGYALLSGGQPERPPEPPPVTLGNPRTADPCSLIDAGALARFGTATARAADVSFAGCRADLAPPSGGDIALFVEFALSQAGATGTTPVQLGVIELHRLTPTATVCWRDLVLPDGTVVAVYAQRFDDGADDLCAVADAGAAAAVQILTNRGVGTRRPLGVTSPLARTEACSLLGPAELDPGALRAPGFGGWSCGWVAPAGSGVYLTYFHGTPPPARSDTSAIGGRTATTVADDGRCRVDLVHRVGPDGRADLVQVTVYGAEPDLCPRATALAATVASRLP